MRRRAFVVYGAALLGLFGWSSWHGWDVLAAHRSGKLPTNIRQAAGGYRSYTFWRGGK